MALLAIALFTCAGVWWGYAHLMMRNEWDTRAGIYCYTKHGCNKKILQL
jgi:hypothetical protein